MRSQARSDKPGRGQARGRVTGPGRHWATDPLGPAAVLAVAAVAVALAGMDVLTWAVVGGLAGYSLSGSV